MDWPAALRGLGAVGSAFGVIRLIKGRRARQLGQIEADVQLYDTLPDSAEAKSTLLAEIDRQVEALIADRTEESRYNEGIAAAILIMGGAAAASWAAVVYSGFVTVLCIVVAGVFWSVGIGFFLDSFRLKRRDDRGREISVSAPSVEAGSSEGSAPPAEKP